MAFPDLTSQVKEFCQPLRVITLLFIDVFNYFCLTVCPSFRISYFLSIHDGIAALDNSWMDICWDHNNADSSIAATGKPLPRICEGPLQPLLERVPITSGPVRHVYSRPFYIVYGTPHDRDLRFALRDLAVYIGNSHAAAHDTHVRVLTDLEYKASSYAFAEETIANLVS